MTDKPFDEDPLAWVFPPDLPALRAAGYDLGRMPAVARCGISHWLHNRGIKLQPIALRNRKLTAAGEEFCSRKLDFRKD